MFGGFRPRAVEVLNIDGFSRDHQGTRAFLRHLFRPLPCAHGLLGRSRMKGWNTAGA